MTLEFGRQTKIELRRRLANDVGIERWTRLNKMLAAEQRDPTVIDLRPGESATDLVRQNRLSSWAGKLDSGARTPTLAKLETVKHKIYTRFDVHIEIELRGRPSAISATKALPISPSLQSCEPLRARASSAAAATKLSDDLVDG